MTIIIITTIIMQRLTRHVSVIGMLLRVLQMRPEALCFRVVCLSVRS